MIQGTSVIDPPTESAAPTSAVAPTRASTVTPGRQTRGATSSPTQPPGRRPRVHLGDAVVAVLALMADPSRLDQVFALGEALNGPAFARMLAQFEADPIGRDLLARRASLDTRSIDFAVLGALPDGTLGREYVRFLRDNGIDPEVWRPPHAWEDRSSWLSHRLRQTHDILHVLTGCASDVAGEVVLQAFTFAQLRTPSCLVIALFGTLKHRTRHPGLARRVWRAWRIGRRAQFLGSVSWELLWHERVEILRARFHVEPC